MQAIARVNRVFRDTTLTLSKAYTLCGTLDEAKSVRDEIRGHNVGARTG